MIPSSAQDRFTRNVEVFKVKQPVLWARLESLTTPASVIEWEGDEAVNLRVADTTLYPKDAREWTAGQLKINEVEPDRLRVPGVNHCNPSKNSLVFLRAINTLISEKKVHCEPSPASEIGFHFVFGLGLGHHLPKLVADRPARTFIVIEPVLEFVLQSMHVIEWGELIESLEGRGCSLVVISEEAPERIVSFLENVVSAKGNLFLDGSWLYAHYYSWAVKESYNVFNEKIKNYFLSSGFFEDEINMLSNTVGNLRQYSSHLISRESYVEKKYPVFLVGAGPSLDDDLPVIKALSDRAFIVSCGTALGVLTKNGIIPDLHVENENVPLVGDIIRKVRETSDLSKVRLVATTTAYPEVAGLFSSRWFYFRGALSPYKLFGKERAPLYGTDPLVVNGGFSAMLRLGFRLFYLFGCDCGSRDRKRHHAESVFYNEDEDLKKKTQNRFESSFDRVVPANFGGQAVTAWHLDLSRRELAAMNYNTRAMAYNCSDGAQIDGMTPLASRAIKLKPLPQPKEEILRRIEGSLEALNPGDFFKDIDFDEFLGWREGFEDRFQACLEGFAEEEASYTDVADKMTVFFAEPVNLPFRVIAGSSVHSMLRMSIYIGTRITDETHQREFRKVVVENLKERFAFLVRETERLIHCLRDGIPYQEPEASDGNPSA